MISQGFPLAVPRTLDSEGLKRPLTTDVRFPMLQSDMAKNKVLHEAGIRRSAGRRNEGVSNPLAQGCGRISNGKSTCTWSKRRSEAGKLAPPKTGVC